MGDNGAGKTTLASAWHWLLFGKDSLGRADFEIKTLTPDGKAIHGLEHGVEATIEVDGETLTLRKVYTEKWTKIRNSVKATFDGHTTQHYLDGVPCTKREFQDKIASLIDENIFRLLTNPMSFNDLHWKKRREILLDICGDISDEDVIAFNPELKDLPEILGKRTVDQHRAVLKKQMAKIKKEIEDTDTRVKEKRYGLPDISQIKPDALASDIARLQDLKASKEAEKLRIEQGGEVAELTKKLREVEGELIVVEGQHKNAQLARTEESRNKLYAIKSARRELELDIQGLEKELERNQTEAKRQAEAMDKLRAEWKEIDAQTFEHEVDDTCPTCGQALPAEQVEEAQEKAQAAFNRNKAKHLERITAEGKELKVKRQELDAKAADGEKELSKCKDLLADLKAQEAELQQEIDSKPAKPLSGNPDYNKLAKEKANLETHIASLKDDSKQDVAAIGDEIAQLTQDIKALEQSQTKVKQHQEAMARVDELKAQEERLAAEYESLQHQQDLCDEFIKAKVSMLDERINSRFELARFKMFDQQVNGGISPTCETLYEGVPWGGGLNNGAKVNVGIDIINTLAEHYGASAPIFADNAESVTEIIPTPAQLIRLVVSEDDKELRVEVE